MTPAAQGDSYELIGSSITSVMPVPVSVQAWSAGVSAARCSTPLGCMPGEIYSIMQVQGHAVMQHYAAVCRLMTSPVFRVSSVLDWVQPYLDSGGEMCNRS